MDCVEVCPVDCFYEGENMLVINPNECIDCGVCEPECPAEAILPDTESGLEKWLEVNSKFSAEWPNITVKKETPAAADEHKGVENKFETLFSPKPGEGDGLQIEQSSRGGTSRAFFLPPERKRVRVGKKG